MIASIEDVRRRATDVIWKMPLLVLLSGALVVSVGSFAGLVAVGDVAYPDSATLLRISEFTRSGNLYPEYNRPPYLVTLYGPLRYVLLAVPYRAAEAASIAPHLLVRLTILAAFCSCVWTVFSIAMRVWNSTAIASATALFAASSPYLATWTTPIRPDFLALALALLSIYLSLTTRSRWRFVGAVAAAGSSLLIKQTFIAAPISVALWLAWQRRWREAAGWCLGVSAVTTFGYVIVWHREPLLAQHVAAIASPLFEYRGALRITVAALAQLSVPFAVVAVSRPTPQHSKELRLVIIYWIVAWCTAVTAIPQVGGNINYFWEPLFAGAVLAGQGLRDARARAGNRDIVAVAIAVYIAIAAMLAVRWDAKFAGVLLRALATHGSQRDHWQALASNVRGHRLLSNRPALAVLSKMPEVPDPYLNAESNTNANGIPHRYSPQSGRNATTSSSWIPADEFTPYRGLSRWSPSLWAAAREAYTPRCSIDDLEVWVPRTPSKAAIQPKGSSLCELGEAIVPVK